MENSSEVNAQGEISMLILKSMTTTDGSSPKDGYYCCSIFNQLLLQTSVFESVSICSKNSDFVCGQIKIFLLCVISHCDSMSKCNGIIFIFLTTNKQYWTNSTPIFLLLLLFTILHSNSIQKQYQNRHTIRIKTKLTKKPNSTWQPDQNKNKNHNKQQRDDDNNQHLLRSQRSTDRLLQKKI